MRVSWEDTVSEAGGIRRRIIRPRITEPSRLDIPMSKNGVSVSIVKLCTQNQVEAHRMLEYAPLAVAAMAGEVHT
jgi:hypothetical protein